MKQNGRNKYLEESGANLLFMQALLDNIAVSKKTRILEIGCGTGLFAQYLAAITGATVTGTEMDQAAQKTAATRIACHYRPKGDLPADIGLFDVIYCKDVLPCNEDKVKFYAMIAAALVQGGIFCTYLPGMVDIATKPVLQFIRQSVSESMKKYGTPENNIDSIVQNGFSIKKMVSLPLGTVKMDANYVHKHWDGYFSNTDSSRLTEKRYKGLLHFKNQLDTGFDYGLATFYEWERILVVAQKKIKQKK